MNNLFITTNFIITYHISKKLMQYYIPLLVLVVLVEARVWTLDNDLVLDFLASDIMYN